MGPLGLVLGLYIGHGFDIHHWQNRIKASTQRQNHSNQAYTVFFKITFLTLGYIAKADGRVSEREIHYAQQIMKDMRLSSHEAKMAKDYFTLGKSAHFDIKPALQEFLKHSRTDPQLVQLYIRYQINMADIDRDGKSEKYAVIDLLQRWLNVRASRHQYQSYTQPNSGGQNQKQYQKQQQSGHHHRAQSGPSLDDDYKILGIPSNSDQKQIKRAYRKLMSRYHPDRLIAKNATQTEIKSATEQTQKIQAAYTRICERRGF